MRDLVGPTTSLFLLPNLQLRGLQEPATGKFHHLMPQGLWQPDTVLQDHVSRCSNAIPKAFAHLLLKLPWSPGLRALENPDVARIDIAVVQSVTDGLHVAFVDVAGKDFRLETDTEPILVDHCEVEASVARAHLPLSNPSLALFQARLGNQLGVYLVSPFLLLLLGHTRSRPSSFSLRFHQTTAGVHHLVFEKIGPPLQFGRERYPLRVVVHRSARGGCGPIDDNALGRRSPALVVACEEDHLLPRVHVALVQFEEVQVMFRQLHIRPSDLALEVDLLHAILEIILGYGVQLHHLLAVVHHPPHPVGLVQGSLEASGRAFVQAFLQDLTIFLDVPQLQLHGHAHHEAALLGEGDTVGPHRFVRESGVLSLQQRTVGGANAPRGVVRLLPLAL
mmetsp:Transcript_33068/g.61463  ORF Transcript_33068/g.61463 Transcript_33068/m.61463 type:complete len:392 (+) Transcript_33068:723-1898(+)